MATTKFNLRTKRADKPQPIRLIFRYDKKRFVYGTGFNVYPKYWNDKKQEIRAVVDVPNRDFVNGMLVRLRDTVETVTTRQLYETGKVDFESLRLHLNKVTGKATAEPTDTTPDLYTFIESFIRASASRINPNTGKGLAPYTIEKYRLTFKRLKEFGEAYERKITFDNIDLDFYNAFVVWMQGVGYATNTIGKHIKTLKTFLNSATNEGKNINLKYKNRDFKAISEEADTVYLTEAELSKMYDLDLTASPRLKRVRDTFLIGAWTGLRYGDVVKIRPENIQDGRLHIRQNKTGGKVVLPILPVVKEILGEYGNSTPPLISNQKLNKYIKEVAQLSGITSLIQKRITKGGKLVVKSQQKWELVTSHTARRSFVTNLYRKDVPVSTIMEMTGHSSGTAFKKYLRADKETHADIVKLALDNPRTHLKAVK